MSTRYVPTPSASSCTKYAVAIGPEPSYRRRIQSLIAHLDLQNLLSLEARPADQRYALITSAFKFIDDYKEWLSFRAQAYGFSMNKDKSTFGRTNQKRLASIMFGSR